MRILRWIKRMIYGSDKHRLCRGHYTPGWYTPPNIIPSGEYETQGYVHEGRYYYNDGTSIPIEYVTSGVIQTKEKT